MTRIPFLLGYAALETGPQAAGSILALDDTPSSSVASVPVCLRGPPRDFSKEQCWLPASPALQKGQLE